MEPEIKLDSRAMLEVYNSLLSKWRSAILDGRRVTLFSHYFAHLDGCAALSQFKISGLDYQDDKIVPKDIKRKIRDKRNEILLSVLYDRLKSMPEFTLEHVLERVRDPLLDAATAWLAAHGGIKSITPTGFVLGFNPLEDIMQDESMPQPASHTTYTTSEIASQLSQQTAQCYESQSTSQLPQQSQYYELQPAPQTSLEHRVCRVLSFYLRPLMLLEIAADHPETIAFLDEDSSYFLHRLFKRKRLTISDIDSELAEVIIELFSENLVNALQRVDEFIQPSQEGIVKFTRLGRYILPSKFSVSFAKHGAEAEKEFRELYNNAEIKSEIYTTLAEVSVLITREIVNKCGSSTPLKGTSSFSIGDSRYAAIKRLIKNYATNQLLGLWKEGANPAYCPETPLSYLLFLKAEIKDGRLAITDINAKRPATSYFTKDSRFLDTSAELPLCVYTLNEYYKTAMEINAERSANAQQETQ